MSLAASEPTIFLWFTRLYETATRPRIVYTRWASHTPPVPAPQDKL